MRPESALALPKSLGISETIWKNFGAVFLDGPRDAGGGGGEGSDF